MMKLQNKTCSVSQLFSRGTRFESDLSVWVDG